MQNEFSLSFGAEVEFIMPFNNNNWSFYIQPTYNSYKGNITLYYPQDLYPYYDLSATLNYINTPIAGRRYIHFSPQSKLFLNLGVNLTFFSSDSMLKAQRQNTTYYGGNRFNFLFGIGYQYRKLSIEIVQYSDLNISPQYSNDYSDNLKNMSLNLKYKLF